MLDSKGSPTLTKIAITTCTEAMRSIKKGQTHAWHSYVREALIVLMENHPKEVWDNIPLTLLSEDALLVYMLENLLKFERDDNFGQGLLYSLPSEMYLDWARQHPENRAHIVVN